MSKLVHSLGAIDVLEVVHTHVVEPRARRHAIDNEVIRGLRQHGLATMGDGSKTRTPDDRGALVAFAVARLHLAGVQRQAYVEWPRLSAPLQLELECAGERVGGECERGDEAVAFPLLDREDALAARNIG